MAPRSLADSPHGQVVGLAHLKESLLGCAKVSNKSVVILTGRCITQKEKSQNSQNCYSKKNINLMNIFLFA